MSDELKKDDWWYIIKKVTFLICLAGFVANSYMCLKQFIGKETVQSQEIKHNKELALPSITICSLSGYKEKITKHQDLKLNNYLNNTLELDEILLWVTNDDNLWTIEQMIKDKTSWQVTTTYSLYKGRCHTISYLHEVAGWKMGHFVLNSKIEFWIYIHDLGEEYFLHHDFWPTIPKKYHVKEADVTIDVMIQKEVKITNKNCEKDEEYSYFDCLRKDFQEIVIENNLNCTYPWIESMKGSLNYKEEEKPTCTASDDYKLANDISMNYATAASSFTHQKCLAPCQLAKYSAGFTAYDTKSEINLDELLSTEDVGVDKNGTAGSEVRLINLFYSTTDEVISTTSLMVDFNTFVSNVGGSLGLFLEFSFIAGFYFIYDLISSRMEK